MHPSAARAPDAGLLPPPLFVRRSGRRGPVLVLLHGLGASGRSWRLVCEQLDGVAQVVCPDLLGFGRSPWPAAAYTVADHLAALEAMLTAQGVDDEPLLLAGHSTGAMLALEWAAARPERFGAVVLMSLPAYRSAAEARRCIRTLSPLAWATVTKPHWGELICGVMCAWRPFWRRTVPLLTPGVPADISRDYVLHNWTTYSSTLRNVLIDHRAAPAAARVAASGVAVQLLHGAADTVAPLPAVRDLARPYGWPVQVLPGAAHHLPVRQAAACRSLLRAVLARVGPVRGTPLAPFPQQGADA